MASRCAADGHPLGACAEGQIASLSPQERRILGLLADGLTNRQIATEMHLAEMTVKNFVSTC